MRIFNTISIETASLCNRKCWFCPNAYNDRPDEIMSSALISKILTELGNNKFNGRIELYEYNEPLRDTRIYDIIAECRKKVPKSCIMIATNADYVKNAQQIDDLYKAGLNQLQINVYSNVPRYRQLTELMKGLSYASKGNVYGPGTPKIKIYTIEEKYDRIINTATQKVGRFDLTNRCGLIPGIPGSKKQMNKVCPRPFRFMQVTWEGKVVICCNDYHATQVCGDLNTDSVYEVWKSSPVFLKYRKELLTAGRSKLPLCCKCDFSGSYPHMVAPFWQELLED